MAKPTRAELEAENARFWAEIERLRVQVDDLRLEIKRLQALVTGMMM